MIIDDKKKFFVCIFLGIVVLLLLGAVFIKLGVNFDKKSYMIYFPDIKTSTLKNEKRVAPNHWNKLKNIEELVNQVILGSEDVFLKDVFPSDTKIVKIAITDNVLYIDLSSQPIFSDVGGFIDIKESIDILKKNIKANYKRLNDIKILINGIEPSFIDK